MSEFELRDGFTIVTQNGCQWCDKAKHLLLNHGYTYVETNLSNSLQDEKIAFMSRFPSNERTVPKVYFDGVLIGGYGDLEAFLQNPLAQLYLQARYPDPIYIKRLSPTAIMPTRGSEEAIGVDLYADLGIGESIVLMHGQVVKIPIGWAMKAPRGHYLRIAPRSGLSLKGVDVLAGVVDRDYTGLLNAILTVDGSSTVIIKHGDRVAQAIAEKASIVPVVEVSDLGSTARGENGFGSTGA